MWLTSLRKSGNNMLVVERMKGRAKRKTSWEEPETRFWTFSEAIRSNFNFILKADGSQGTTSELLNRSGHREKLDTSNQAHTSSMAIGSSHLSSEQSSQGAKTHISNYSVPHIFRPTGKAKPSHTQFWNHVLDPKAYHLHSIQNVDVKHFSSSLMHSALIRWKTRNGILARLSYHHGGKGLPRKYQKPRQGSCTWLPP